MHVNSSGQINGILSLHEYWPPRLLKTHNSIEVVRAFRVVCNFSVL